MSIDDLYSLHNHLDVYKLLAHLLIVFTSSTLILETLTHHESRIFTLVE